MTMIANLQSMAEVSGGRLINCVVAGMLVALLVWALLRATDCRNSGTRFAVWFSALLAIVGLSFTAFPVGGGGNAIGTRIPHVTLPASWLWHAFLIWIAVASFGLLRIGVSLAQIWLLRRRSRELAETEIDPLLRQTMSDFRASRRVKVCVSDELRVPTAIGVITPAVIIPHWALEELSPGELNAVLLHELGHLGRRDDWTNLAQKMVRAVLFFHPAVWWIDSRLTLEREMACDDFVLARTSDAQGYAQCLVSVAEKSLLRSGLALALAAVSRMRQMTVRLARILDPNRLNETRISKPALAGVTIAGLMALLALPHTPTLVEFRNTAPFASGELLVPAALIHQTSFQPEPSRLQPGNTVACPGQPHVVNAVLKTSAPADHRMQSKTGAARIQAKTAKRPQLVKTSMKAQQPSGPMLLYVVQTEEFNGPESQSWSVRVWQMTVTLNQKEIQAQNGTVAKSI